MKQRQKIDCSKMSKTCLNLILFNPNSILERRYRLKTFPVKVKTITILLIIIDPGNGLNESDFKKRLSDANLVKLNLDGVLLLEVNNLDPSITFNFILGVHT